MAKSFDDLTMADDFMFCKVMQDEEICKEFLEMVLVNKIGKIIYLSPQNAIVTGSESKSMRLDLLVKDDMGKSYDIEMQVANERNIPKRMRKSKPIYTFENICLEDRQTSLQDGTRKVIINAEAFRKAKDKELKGFLEYVKIGTANTEYTGRIETMIQTVKNNEQARQEYRFMTAFEMDALDKGEAIGARQAKLETAKNLLGLGLSIENIAQATGLLVEEIENLSK